MLYVGDEGAVAVSYLADMGAAVVYAKQHAVPSKAVRGSLHPSKLPVKGTFPRQVQMQRRPLEFLAVTRMTKR